MLMLASLLEATLEDETTPAAILHYLHSCQNIDTSVLGKLLSINIRLQRATELSFLEWGDREVLVLSPKQIDIVWIQRNNKHCFASRRTRNARRRELIDSREALENATVRELIELGCKL